jgi:hypothetical protein
MNATFIDRNGVEREFNKWYPMPFVVEIHGLRLALIPVQGKKLEEILFWKLADGSRVLANHCIFAPLPSRKVAWGVFNDTGYYEI